MKRRNRVLWLVAGVLVSAAAVTRAQSPTEPVPAAAQVVEKACQAAGGWDTFRRLGVLKISVSQEEITNEGTMQKAEMGYLVSTPGPAPLRLEIPASGVVAGDDGKDGWAVVRGKPDPRPTTPTMIRRLAQTSLVTLLLPFSLRWEGVDVMEVAPAVADGTPVWRLTVDFGRSFFQTPQVATRWQVDVDRRTWKVVGASSPATDLGKGVKADGMKYSWAQPVSVGGLTLPGSERVVGLDEVGTEKTHSRNRKITYEKRTRDEVAAMFENPIPPDQRPNLMRDAKIKPPALPPAK